MDNLVSGAISSYFQPTFLLQDANAYCLELRTFAYIYCCSIKRMSHIFYYSTNSFFN